MPNKRFLLGARWLIESGREENIGTRECNERIMTTRDFNLAIEWAQPKCVVTNGRNDQTRCLHKNHIVLFLFKAPNVLTASPDWNSFSATFDLKYNLRHGHCSALPARWPDTQKSFLLCIRRWKCNIKLTLFNYEIQDVNIFLQRERVSKRV